MKVFWSIAPYFFFHLWTLPSHHRLTTILLNPCRYHRRQNHQSSSPSFRSRLIRLQLPFSYMTTTWTHRSAVQNRSAPIETHKSFVPKQIHKPTWWEVNIWRCRSRWEAQSREHS